MAWQQLDELYLSAGFTEKELATIKKKIRKGDVVKTYKRVAAEMDCGDDAMDNGRHKRIELNIEETKTKFHFIIEYHACVNSGKAFLGTFQNMVRTKDWLFAMKGSVATFLTSMTAQGTYKITINWVVHFAKRYSPSQYNQKIRDSLFSGEKVGKLGCGSVAIEQRRVTSKVEWDNLVGMVEKEANEEGNLALSVWDIPPFVKW
jgi:hypothetical protein